MKLKPKHKWRTGASYYLSRGGNVEGLVDFAKDYESVTQEEIDSYIKDRTIAQATSSAIFMGKKELDIVYNELDKKILEAYPEIVAYERGENVEFYEYKGGVYIRLTDLYMTNLVDSMMAQYCLFEHRTKSRNIKDTIHRLSSLLSRMEGRYFNDAMVRNKKWYLNVANGLLDTKTYILLPHTKDYFSTVQAPYPFDMQATCTVFEDFIATISSQKPETILMIQEMAGYMLTEGNPKHKVFYLYGNTARNGKSTLAKIICGLVGWDNVSMLALSQIASDNSSILTSIVGKQINFSDEVSSKYIESSRLTAMSAEGVVEINPKYKNTFPYQVRAKFLVTCNDLPKFKEMQGMKYRMISIPFEHHIKEGERIERYDEVLLEREGSGILNWAIKGLKMINDATSFTISDVSREDMEDNTKNSTYSYLEEFYDFDPAFEEPTGAKELYGVTASRASDPTDFCLFCQSTGIQTPALYTFSKELKRFADETKKIKQVRKDNVRYYVGLKKKDQTFNKF